MTGWNDFKTYITAFTDLAGNAGTAETYAGVTDSVGISQTPAAPSFTYVSSNGSIVQSVSAYFQFTVNKQLYVTDGCVDTEKLAADTLGRTVHEIRVGSVDGSEYSGYTANASAFSGGQHAFSFYVATPMTDGTYWRGVTDQWWYKDSNNDNRCTQGTVTGGTLIVDGTAPTMSSVTATNSTVTVTMSEPVYAATTPTATDFKVKSGASGSETANVVTGITGLPTAEASADNSFTLTVTTAFTVGNSVKVYYTKGTNVVDDRAGNDMATLAEASALTTTATGKTISISAVSTDDYINATEDDSAVLIAGTSTGLTSGTSITVTLDDADADSNADHTFTATTNSTGAWTTAATDLTAARVQALDEGEMTITASATGATSGTRTVTYDATVPTISTVTASGTTLTATMSEDVYAATSPDNSDFSFSSGTQTVSGIGGLASTAATADNSFTLTISAALSGSPTLGYTQNSTDAKIIKDAAGNKLATASGITISSGVVSAPSAPSGITLTTPASSPGNDTTPTFRVTVGETGGTVTLYSDSACSSANAVSSATNVTDNTSPYTVDVTTNAYSTDGAKTVYAKHTKDSQDSTCSTATGTYTLDTAVPTVSTATYSGSTITLAMSENVAVSGTKTGGDFTITGGGAPTVSSYTISGSTVTLTLSAAITGGGSVTLAYAKNATAANRITDTAGNELAAISSQSVVNKTISISAVSTDDYINATEDNSAVLIAGTSTGLANNTSITVTLDDADADSNADHTFTVATNSSGAWTTASTDLTAARVQALDEGEMTITASATGATSGTRTVTYDATVPTISTVAASGTTLTVTMSENVYAATAPDNGDFATTGGGAPTISGISGLPTTVASADNSFTLTISAAFTPSTPTLGYTQNGTDAKIIKDKAGNKLATVTGQSISGVPVAPAAPTLALQSPASSPGNDSTPTIRVTVDSSQQNGTVQLYSDSGCTTSISSSVTVDSATEDVTVTTTLTEAGSPYSIYAKHTNSSNLSTCSTTSVSYTYDGTAPTATVSGAPSGSSSTTTLDVTVAGTGVTHYKSKAVAGACSTGNYGSETAVATKITTDISALADGTVRLCVIGRDAAGNWQATGSATEASWTKDTAAPTITTGTLDLAAADDTGTNTDNITSTTDDLTISGTLSAAGATGDYVQLYNNGIKIAGATDTTLSNTAWSVDIDLIEGSHSITAKVLDAADNEGTASSALTIVVDTTVPSVTYLPGSEGGTMSGGDAVLAAGDKVVLDMVMSEAVDTAPTVQFKHGSGNTNFGSAITATDTKSATVYYDVALTGSDSGKNSDPLDFGAPPASSGIVREVLSGGYIYKVTKAVDTLSIRATVRFNSAGSPLSARWATTAPTANTLTTHGSGNTGGQLWNESAGNPNNSAGGGRTLTSVPANSYFWIFPNGSSVRTASERTLFVAGGPATAAIESFAIERQSAVDDADDDDPIDFTDMSSAGFVVRETLGDGYVYRTTKPFSALTFTVRAGVNQGAALRMRWAESKPATTAVDSHGTLIAQIDSSSNVWYTTQTIHNMPEDSYLWLYPTADRDVSNRFIALSGVLGTSEKPVYTAAHTIQSTDPDVADGNLKYDVTNETSVTDTAGNQIATKAVTVISNTVIDNTVPTISSAVYNSSTITLTMSEDVAVSGTKTGGDFTVTGGGAPTVSSYTISGSTVSLTLSAAIPSGSTVTLAYAQNATEANRITDIAGNELAAVSSQSVTDKALFVSAVSTDDYINDAEDESSLTISGTATGIADSTSISVAVDGSGTDVTKTTTVSSNAWSVSLTSAQVKALDAATPDADGEEI